jgi:hypothetical protein
MRKVACVPQRCGPQRAKGIEQAKRDH